MSVRKLVLLAIPAVFWAAQEIHPFGPPFPANRALCLLFAMALWWITEALPIHWVALLPIVTLPFLHVTGGDQPFLSRVWLNFELAGRPFLHPLLFLFLGGMTIGVAMERHNLHKRIALNVIRLVGSNPRRLLLGFVLAAAFLSLWISNTATAVMMVPIGLAVMSEIERREGRRPVLLGQSIMLSIAYAANVGGIGTLIGTAPNAIFAGFVQSRYDLSIGFLPYLLVGLPFVALFLPIVFAALAWLCRKEAVRSFGPDILDAELQRLGRISRGEKVVLGVFVCTCLAWILNEPIRRYTGLGAFLRADEFDACAALLAALSLFLLPLRWDRGVISAGDLRRVPWDALILLGGSFALAAVVQQSGLVDWLAEKMKATATLGPFLLLLVITLSTVFLSAFSSNTATTTLMLPLVAGALGSVPPGWVLPCLSGVAIAASCDFMLPAGTPPNAIVFGTRYVRMRTMAGVGAWLDAAAAIVAALWAYFGISRLLPLVLPV